VLVLICYDISTVTKDGKKRLRTVARACEDYGVRVQFSIFECMLNDAEWVNLRSRLLDAFDESTDSLRFYRLDQKARRSVEHHGNRMPIDLDAPLII
jgi:CRISPR-associated protein Cas2